MNYLLYYLSISSLIATKYKYTGYLHVLILIYRNKNYAETEPGNHGPFGCFRHNVDFEYDHINYKKISK